MKYKAIMLDLDDTTVVHGKDSLPTLRVTEAIAKAQEKIHVCIATARTLTDAKPVLSHLALSGPCVITNGTQIYDPIKKEIIYEVTLPQDILPKIFDLCRRYKLIPLVHDGTKDVRYQQNKVSSKALSVYIPEVEMGNIDFLVKVFSIDARIHVQKLVAWDKHYMSLDITSSEASKLHGILEVSRILGITTEEIIGVGDGYNDFPLLMACGLKIAMGNAVPELKEIADFIAPTVHEDGVATVIEKFVLQ